MREILFRGKDIISGEWITGFLVDAQHIGNWVEAYAIMSETVGQFTGLTDKNGKKIFEGDIVKSDDVAHNDEVQVRGEIFQVSMQKGCWVIVANDTAWDFLCSNTKSCQIIGNIHDNPELLEVSEGG